MTISNQPNTLIPLPPQRRNILSGIVTPRDVDVLVGRGTVINQHVGNITFRKLVDIQGGVRILTFQIVVYLCLPKICSLPILFSTIPLFNAFSFVELS